MERRLADSPAGSHAVATATVDGVRLIATSYKYNRKKASSTHATHMQHTCNTHATHMQHTPQCDTHTHTHTQVLHFISTCGKTTPGDPYVAKWSDEWGNLSSKDIPRPKLISTYFAHSNVIDVHNQQRQGELELESKWETKDCWFRLVTTMFGIVATDTWLAMQHVGRSKDTIKGMTAKLAGMMIDSGELADEDDGSDSAGVSDSVNDSVLTCTQIAEHRCGSLTAKFGKRTQRRCIMCTRFHHRSTKTSFYCERCDVALCSGASEGSCFTMHIANNGPPSVGAWKSNPEHDPHTCELCHANAEKSMKRTQSAQREKNLRGLMQRKKARRHS